MTMEFYSTNNRLLRADLKTVVMEGLAPDGGLYMPLVIPKLDPEFVQNMKSMSYTELAHRIAWKWLGDDLSTNELKKLIDNTTQFEAPLIEVSDQCFALELFHGPTAAFKDFGARFLSGLLGYFASLESREITILAATSGDTGSAVANGFYNVDGIRVIVLYPSGQVSEIQEKQFTTLGGNVTALEVMGTFDDCQAMVKRAFLDPQLRQKLTLSSANSINIGRLIPQTFYYFRAYAQWEIAEAPVISVPSGNFGNLTAGVMAERMGLPVKKFVASTNMNDTVPHYLRSGKFSARPSRHTISNAMDVGNPSNFVRLLELHDGNWNAMAEDISGFSFSDDQTREIIRSTVRDGYLLDPHGAIGLLGLREYQKGKKAPGIFLATAHPGKFKETVDEIISKPVELPERLAKFLKQKKQSVRIPNEYGALQSFLLG
jgi:threonine synthase